ncbi:MAG: peptidoglycan DD-metalloendopeptidase family protein, partial [Pseudomonadota bacterium]
LLLAFSANAANPTPEKARKELNGTLKEIKLSEAEQKQIIEKRLQVAKELKQIQESIVKIADDSGEKENQLLELEDKIAILQEQKNAKNSELAARRTELSAMISAMIKLKQFPEEAIIAMPGKLEDTLATARMLGVIGQAVDDNAKSLQGQLHELDELEDKIVKSRDLISDKKSQLQDKQSKLNEKIKERAKLQQDLLLKEQKEKEKTARLIAKSRNLQELIDSLTKSAEEETDISQSAIKNGDNNKRKLHAFSNSHMKLPASGKITKSYANDESPLSKGIIITTRENANVVAPFEGEVVYAGNFRDYGRIVIIRHGGDYHTLLSGIDKISCVPGQFLLAGEVIASMGKSSNRLYMELRKGGKSINPSEWLNK